MKNKQLSFEERMLKYEIAEETPLYTVEKILTDYIDTMNNNNFLLDSAYIRQEIADKEARSADIIDAARMRTGLLDPQNGVEVCKYLQDKYGIVPHVVKRGLSGNNSLISRKNSQILAKVYTEFEYLDELAVLRMDLHNLYGLLGIGVTQSDGLISVKSDVRIQTSSPAGRMASVLKFMANSDYRKFVQVPVGKCHLVVKAQDDIAHAFQFLGTMPEMRAIYEENEFPSKFLASQFYNLPQEKLTREQFKNSAMLTHALLSNSDNTFSLLRAYDIYPDRMTELGLKIFHDLVQVGKRYSASSQNFNYFRRMLSRSDGATISFSNALDYHKFCLASVINGGLAPFYFDARLVVFEVDENDISALVQEYRRLYSVPIGDSTPLKLTFDVYRPGDAYGTSTDNTRVV